MSVYKKPTAWGISLQPMGQKPRNAFGFAQIPFGCCLEIELIAELEA